MLRVGSRDERLPILVARLSESSAVDVALGALAFCGYEQFGTEDPARAFTGAAAETMIRALRLDEPLYAAEIRYEDGTERMEVWRSGGVLASWTSSTRGYRYLQLGSIAMAKETIRLHEHKRVEKEAAGVETQVGVAPILASIVAPSADPRRGIPDERYEDRGRKS
ncbi:MAG: hypothetical protein ACYDB4_08455 [Candidatus Dormibacteraceae bacterium]